MVIDPLNILQHALDESSHLPRGPNDNAHIEEDKAADEKPEHAAEQTSMKPDARVIFETADGNDACEEMSYDHP